MGKFIAILLALILILLSACDNSHSDDKTAKNPNRPSNPFATEPTVQTDPYQGIKDKLVGTWENWGAQQIISFVDYERCVWISMGLYDSEVRIVETIYTLENENTILFTPITEGFESQRHTFSIDGDELRIIQEGYEDCYYNPLQRVPDTSHTNCSIVGEWSCYISSYSLDVPYYHGKNWGLNTEHLIFYTDGSCTISNYNTYYEIVHDGASVCVDGDYYWSITIPCPQVMIIQFTDEVTQIYLAQ